jgi:iron complex outermembrane receptor protein
VFNPVVVSASRREEKVLEAPAAATVIGEGAIAVRPALTPVDHVYDAPGMHVATTGLIQHEVVARGFNNIASGALLVLADNRYVHVPSLRINVYNFLPLTDEDVERIELVRGPGSALYGPNSSNGVMHVISRSPFDAPGGTITLSGGERGVAHGQLRYAAALSERFALKVSGQYLRGRDWPLSDPQDAPLDTTIERVSGEVRLDWRPTGGTSLTGTVGVNQAISSTELTPLGGAQVVDWRYSYAQLRLRSGRLFGQVYLNASNSGETLLLRADSTIVDKSQMLVAQLQHGALLGSAVNLTYGLDVQRTVPRTEGTLTGRNEDDDTMNEIGAYVQAEAELTPAVRLVVAARGDYHSRLDDPVFSPRAAVVFHPARDHSLRLTYNRAFSTPTTNNLFLDLVGDVLPTPVPLPVRLVGVPETGFSFRRDCDSGLCMRSPYTPPAGGGPGTYLPLDVTLLWPTVVLLAESQGIDLSQVPPPTSADIRTVLARLNIGTGAFEPVTDATDLPPLKPTIDNAIEVGYRGTFGNRVTFGIDAYRGWKTDFVGGEQVETPSAFFHEEDLRDYLIAAGASATDAALFAAAVAQIPAGTVTPQEARDPWDILVTYRNFGDITFWGAEVELGAILTDWLAVRGNYSWVSDDTFDAVDATGRPATIPLNAPANRAAFALLFRSRSAGLDAQVRGRWVDGFPVSSGEYLGDVEAYTVVDALVAYRLPFARQVMVSINALNVFDHDHVEFVGAPSIGRLVMGSVRAEF